MVGFDMTVIVIGLVAGTIAALLLRALSRSSTQSAGHPGRAEALAGGADLPLRNLSDIGDRAVPPRSSVAPRAATSPPVVALTEKIEISPERMTPPLPEIHTAAAPTEQGASPENDASPESAVQSATDSDPTPKKEFVEPASQNTPNGYGRRKTDLMKEETVKTLWSNLKRERTARFISFINFKGGVGKSTTAVETAAALAKHFGKRVLLIDLDPQTNATFYLMDHSEWESWQETNGSLKTLFEAYLSGKGESFDVSRVIKKDLLCHGGAPLAPGFELLPSHLALVQIDIQLAAKTTVGESVFSSQAIIRQALEQVQDQYDYIIFDCPPNFNLVTQNGLFASDGYVIPAIPDYLSTLGINLIQGEVNRFSDRIRHALAMFGGTFTGPDLKGIIFTRVRLRSRKPLRFVDLHERRIHEVYRTNPDMVFKNFISEAVRFAEAPERQMPVSLSPRPEDRDARDEFVRLAEEFIERIDGKERTRGTDEHSWPRTHTGEHLRGAA